MPVEVITHQNQTLGIIIPADFRADGIQFFTPNMFSQQLGYMNRPAGHQIDPHVHKPVQRQVIWTQEVLLVKSGRMRVDFYSSDQQYLESRMVRTGDVVLLAAGGHGFEMIEPTEIIEIKQGPYFGDQDKTRFDAVAPHQIELPPSQPECPNQPECPSQPE
jgi:mannose-6-phosphate isomerase-like protein (cupin superfamily)